MSKYHIRDKFVIEIDEVFENNADDFIHEKELYRIKGFNSLVFDDNGLDKLQKYETFTVRPDAWDESLKEQYNKGLEDGRNEVWELAEKLCTPKLEGGIHYDDIRKIFEVNRHWQVFTDYTPQEALAKLEAYEKGQEIKVGDVVEVAKGTLGIITYANSDIDNYSFVDFIGFTRNDYKATDLKKTGKRIDLTDLFKQIGE